MSKLEQATGNRKTRTRIPAQSKASLFPQKDFKFFKFEIIILFPDILSWRELKKTYPRTCIYINKNFKAIITLTNHP